jgi:hypothetical protein
MATNHPPVGDSGAEAVAEVFGQLVTTQRREHQPPEDDIKEARWLARSASKTLAHLGEPWTLRKVVHRVAEADHLSDADRETVIQASEAVGDAEVAVPAHDVALAAYVRPVWLTEWAVPEARLGEDEFQMLYEAVPLLATSEPALPHPYDW